MISAVRKLQPFGMVSRLTAMTARASQVVATATELVSRAMPMDPFCSPTLRHLIFAFQPMEWRNVSLESTHGDTRCVPIRMASCPSSSWWCICWPLALACRPCPGPSIARFIRSSSGLWPCPSQLPRTGWEIWSSAPHSYPSAVHKLSQHMEPLWCTPVSLCLGPFGCTLPCQRPKDYLWRKLRDSFGTRQMDMTESSTVMLNEHLWWNIKTNQDHTKETNYIVRLVRTKNIILLSDDPFICTAGVAIVPGPLIFSFPSTRAHAPISAKFGWTSLALSFYRRHFKA